MDNWIAAVPGI